MKTILIAVLIILTGCGTSKLELRYLDIIPPPGTSRVAVESVYGTPDEVVTLEPPPVKVRVPKERWLRVDPPRHQYLLLPDLAKLLVIYKDDYVVSAKLWQYRYASAGRPIVQEGSKEWHRHRKEDAIAARNQSRDREEIRRKLAKVLTRAEWNQRKLEQRNEGSVEPN